MKVGGEASLHASVAQVWNALNDPNILVQTIPGCERLESFDRDAYRMTVTAGVASIKGAYDGEVRITDQHEPSSFVLHASGSGAPGTVSADVVVTLADAGDGTTRLTYDADAVVGGMVGGVGQRVLSGVAKKTAGEFFRNVDALLAAPTAPSGVTTFGMPDVATTGAGTSWGPAWPVEAGRSAEDAGGTTPGRAYVRPPSTQASGSPDFLKGAAFGALVALLGALVGGLVARRRP